MTEEITEERKIWQQLGLGGASMLIAFEPGDGRSRKQTLSACVMHLMSDGHGHHFAVVGEGYSLACSLMAVECLRSAGLLAKEAG